MKKETLGYEEKLCSDLLCKWTFKIHMSRDPSKALSLRHRMTAMSTRTSWWERRSRDVDCTVFDGVFSFYNLEIVRFTSKVDHGVETVQDKWKGGSRDTGRTERTERTVSILFSLGCLVSARVEWVT